jgi:hypothetical protein
MSAILPTTVSLINPAPALELTEAEQLEVQKWITKYNEGSKNDRYQLLKTKILPQLYSLNQHLTNEAWKIRKAVCKTAKIFSQLL